MTSIRLAAFCAAATFAAVLCWQRTNGRLCADDGFCSERSSDYLMVCYYTDWSSYRQGKGAYQPEDIIGAPCTDVVYSFAKLNDETLDAFEPDDKKLAIDEHFYERVTALKKEGFRVLLGAGGWNESKPKYSKMMADKNLRGRLAKQAADFLVRHRFDGLNLDVEYPGAYQGTVDPRYAQDKTNFVHFLRDLRRAFDEKAKASSANFRLSLSTAVSANEKIVDVGYDVAALVDICDWIGVMTYDFFGKWDKVTGCVAPFQPQPGETGAASKFNVMDAMKVWTDRGATANKLVVGFPCYGRSFGLDDESETYIKAPASAEPDEGEFTKEAGILAFYEIIDNVYERKWNVVHETCLETYAFKSQQWVSYDDAADAAVKANYIKQKCFYGAMFWSLDNECFQEECSGRGGRYPLIRTVNDVLYDKIKLKEVVNVT